MHNVVFEYLAEAGGYAGTRFYCSYRSLAESQKAGNDPRLKIIAEGVSDDEAQNLTALTPEICRITAAIHEASYRGDGTVDPAILHHHLQMAVFAIMHDRELIDRLKLNRPENYATVEVGAEKNEVNSLLNVALDYAKDPYGEVDIDNILSQLHYQLLVMVEERILNSFQEIDELLDGLDDEEMDEDEE
ncbi:MAG TPA: hypothetical protein VF837_04895 [Patescibacteria group bacterium]